MAEYNIQMNRYVSASDSYDQLFPKTKTIDVVDQNGDNLDTLLGEKIDYDEKGAANGVASLGADGKVPSSQLPATGYSKDETLTAATAALYGLPNTAVPDDVFAWIANNRLKIETGSYAGTGTYGAGNPNILTFGFMPKLFGVIEAVNNIGGRNILPNIILFGENRSANMFYTSTSSTMANMTFSGTTVSWYTTDSYASQLNGTDFTYNYFAIG